MMLKRKMEKWRKEITDMMISSGYRRTPALRRSDKEQFLFATDYPLAADDQDVLRFIGYAHEAGWQTETDHGWIYLSRKPELNEGDGLPAPGPESACCLSLLKRHAGDRILSDGSAERMLLKAAEEGADAYENACERLHYTWAGMLRESGTIPDIDERFFQKENGK